MLLLLLLLMFGVQLVRCRYNRALPCYTKQVVTKHSRTPCSITYDVHLLLHCDVAFEFIDSAVLLNGNPDEDKRNEVAGRLCIATWHL